MKVSLRGIVTKVSEAFETKAGIRAVRVTVFDDEETVNVLVPAVDAKDMGITKGAEVDIPCNVRAFGNQISMQYAEA